MGIHVVWFKRDLRVRDHAPLFDGARAGRVVCLYVYEPERLAAEDHDPSHLVFANQCLAELAANLERRGARLTLRIGNLPEAFDRLAEALRPAGGMAGLWSHEETGGDVTYQRDIRVKRWCRARGVPWTEIPQHGVVRPLKNRDGWARIWHRRMRDHQAPTPERIVGVDDVLPDFDHGRIREPADLELLPSLRTRAQPGGASRAQRLLRTFLHARGENYRADMASPVAGWRGCSRLSPHLAYGAISLRQVYQDASARRDALRSAGPDPATKRWLGSVESFVSRLHWHCHFMQKLEDEPMIEFRTMNRAYAALRAEARDPAVDAARLAAWRDGQTGYPMIDACMRCLHDTGWINFRMRAMLMSFAAYHLWLDWRRPAVHLARLFLDFEPGIHYSQCQMQSGVTGINTVRIYAPAKQVIDQDPRGAFIRRWVPELAEVPDAYIAEPHTMPALAQKMANCFIGRDYPAPIVDHAAAYAQARDRIFAVRRTSFAREEAVRVYQKHGSRRRAGRGRALRRAVRTGVRPST
ncbi:MAG: FAD-binding domain-containing protein [Acidobacteriota bacterium]